LTLLDARIVQDAFGEPSIRGQKHPGSDYPDAIHFFFLQPCIVVSAKEGARGVIGDAGDYRDFVTLGDPSAAVLMGTIGGGVDLGRKVVADE